MMRRLLPFLIAPAVLWAQTAGRAAVGDDPARKFFADGTVVEIAITLTPADRQRLREQPRAYVPATLQVDGQKTPWSGLGLKLKGAAGSFRKVDERPGFTVNLGKYGGTERLHGLRRFHLNNGAQDDTLLCEWLGGEIFAAAGYPAPRVAHARVLFDGEDLGLYVLREAYDDQFLQRNFGAAHGNLYDGGFCQDLDRPLQKDAGDGPDDRADLKRLLAVGENFEPERVARLEAALDVAAFVDFMALEAMLGHWDGYCQNRNNYRLWCDQTPASTRFLPHGMDQILGDVEASVLEHPSAILAGAVQQHPAWRALYRERLEALLPLFRPGKLGKQLEARGARLQQVLRGIDRDRAADHKRAVRDLIDRLEARYKSLQQQVKAPEPEPLGFRGEVPVRLERWNPAGETEEIELQKRSYRGTPALQIACTSRGDSERRGAYRTSVLLARGSYRLLATVRCEDVERPPDENGNASGGVRLVVGDCHSEALGGDQNWTELVCEFEVTEFRRSVEPRLELRALDGRVWFRVDALRLQRIDPR